MTDFLAWQAAIVREYARPGQFATHDFDFEWRGDSYGIQPDVDHFAASKALDVAGVDIYHPTQDALTGLEHPVWGKYAAITENSYGKGLATYVGFMPSEELLARLLEDAVRKAGLWGADQSLAFPIVTKSGKNRQGTTVRYYFNYSAGAVTLTYPHANGKDLLGRAAVAKGSPQRLEAWGVMIVLED